MSSGKILLFFFLFVTSITLRAGDYYVSPNGADNSSVAGTSVSESFASIAYAAERTRVIPGEHTIHVSAGIYVENRSIRLNPNISIIGAGMDDTHLHTRIDSAFLDLSMEYVCTVEANAPCIWSWKENHETNGNQILKGFSIQNLQPTASLSQGIIVYGRHNVTIEDIRIEKFLQHGIAIAANKNIRGFNLEPNFYIKNLKLSSIRIINCGKKERLTEERTGALSIDNLDGADIFNLTIYTNPSIPDSLIGYGMSFDFFGWFKNCKFHDCSIMVGPIKRPDGNVNNFAIGLPNFLKGNEIYNIKTNGILSFSNSKLADSLSNDRNLKVYNNQFTGEKDPRFSSFQMDVLLSGIEIYDNYFYNMNKQGILITNGDGVNFSNKRDNIRIHHNVFHNPTCPSNADESRGIVVKGGQVKEIQIVNNLFYHIARPVYFETDSSSFVSGAKIYNNHFVKICDRPFTTLNLLNKQISDIEILNNLFEQSTNPYQVQNLGGEAATNVTFSNNTDIQKIENYSMLSLSGTLYSDYFRTLCNSPTIDAGIATEFSFTGNAPDIGPFENDCIYPQSLISFKGEILKDNTIQISWNVKNERFIYGYYIEKSIDGVAYEVLSFVPADSTFKSVQEYFIVDSVIEKNNYFRLRQVTTKKDVTYYGPVFIGVPDKIDMSFIYPVPAKNKIEFSISSDMPGDIKITLFDVIGKTHYQSKNFIKKGYNFFELNVSHLAPGCYFVGVYSLTEKYFVSKQMFLVE